MKHELQGKVAATLRKALTGFMGETPNVIEMDVAVSGTKTKPVFSVTTADLKEAGIVIKLSGISLKPETSKVSIVWDNEDRMVVTELEHKNTTPKGSTPDVRPAKQGRELI